MQPYTQYLKSITDIIFRDHNNEFYNELTNLINQDVLNNTTDAMESFRTDFNNYTNCKYSLKSRSQKTMNRINIKKLNNKSDINFKTNSDLCAFTINCEINDIKNVIDTLDNFTKLNNGFGYLRNDIFSESNRDIIAYYFLYIPKYNYIFEFQVGHKFASYVFARDSYLRDKPHMRNTIVDLWQNDFYNHVKNTLIELNDNNNNNKSYLPLKYNIYNELNELYNGKEIENDLINALDGLYHKLVYDTYYDVESKTFLPRHN